MPHAAFYVVQLNSFFLYIISRKFQCRTQHFMWCNLCSSSCTARKTCFNAARSILCGATIVVEIKDSAAVVSMPHAAFYVVQHIKSIIKHNFIRRFQCRTQHFMWCNLLIRKELVVL